MAKTLKFQVTLSNLEYVSKETFMVGMEHWIKSAISAAIEKSQTVYSADVKVAPIKRRKTATSNYADGTRS